MEEDAYTRNPDLLATAPKPKRLYGYDWQSGLISPYRPAPQQQLTAALDAVSLHVHRDQFQIADLGCGDGVILFAALDRWKTGLTKVIGIELDKALLVSIREKAGEKDIKRMELWVGDMTGEGSIYPWPEPQDTQRAENKRAIDVLAECSVVFVYLLPDALVKLKPLLAECLQLGAIVVSLQWPIQDLDTSLMCSDPQQGYYLYKASP
ncbi:hypothetical protein BZG36_04210 [Bifiguratus adelaidae]|uniref:Methyltransferase domain-containing protein n=1 Tax=Bifiguratus adelaidae TaxID=1938954 RepID=A0A261XYE1_9FUNG|nr:hypothetical protein BZG36_04210 [Bifiguratus adelaidae]